MGSKHLSERGGGPVRIIDLPLDMAIAVRIAVTGDPIGRINREQASEYVVNILRQHIPVPQEAIDTALQDKKQRQEEYALRRLNEGVRRRLMVVMRHPEPGKVHTRHQFAFSKYLYHDVWHSPPRVDVQILNGQVAFFPIDDARSDVGYKVSAGRCPCISSIDFRDHINLDAGKHAVEQRDGVWCVTGPWQLRRLPKEKGRGPY